MILMRDESLQQPAVIECLVHSEAKGVHRIAAEIRRRDACFVVIAARGGSDNAARYGKHLIGVRRLCSFVSVKRDEAFRERLDLNLHQRISRLSLFPTPR